MYTSICSKHCIDPKQMSSPSLMKLQNGYFRGKLRDLCKLMNRSPSSYCPSQVSVPIETVHPGKKNSSQPANSNLRKGPLILLVNGGCVSQKKIHSKANTFFWIWIHCVITPKVGNNPSSHNILKQIISEDIMHQDKLKG
jgi:hypothetical protein